MTNSTISNKKDLSETFESIPFTQAESSSSNAFEIRFSWRLKFSIFGVILAIYSYFFLFFISGILPCKLSEKRAGCRKRSDSGQSALPIQCFLRRRQPTETWFSRFTNFSWINFLLTHLFVSKNPKTKPLSLFQLLSSKKISFRCVGCH